MKKLFNITTIFVFLGLLLFISCQEEITQNEEILTQEQLEKKNKSKDCLPIEERVNTGTALDCGTAEFTLWAGKHNDDGTVTVSNDDEYVYVTYTTAGSVDLKEIHLYVWTNPAEVPCKRPAPGHADYVAEGINANEYTVEIPLGGDIECDSEIYIAAHAALSNGETAYGGDSPPVPAQKKGAWFYVDKYTVCCDEPCEEDAVLLATENNKPALADTEMEVRIWKINPSNGVSELISEIIAPIDGSPKDNFPSQTKGGNFNGNAWDAENYRFYFTEFGTNNRYGEDPYPSKLYFNDLDGNQTFAGQLDGAVGGATFYNGAYYFINQRTNDLIKVTFNTDGSILDEEKVADLFNNEFIVGLGDIAIDSDGTMYGSATIIGSFDNIFFKSNLDGSGYEAIVYIPRGQTSDNLFGAGGTQIAFGADGVLYGVNAREPYELFSIDKETGTTTKIAELPVPFSDLATGPACP